MKAMHNTVSRGLVATGRRFPLGRRALAAGALLATAGAAQAQDAAAVVTALTGGIGGLDEHMWTIGGAVAAIVAVVVVVTLLLRNGKKVATSS